MKYEDVKRSVQFASNKAVEVYVLGAHRTFLGKVKVSTSSEEIIAVESESGVVTLIDVEQIVAISVPK